MRVVPGIITKQGQLGLSPVRVFYCLEDLCVSVASRCVLGLGSGSEYAVETFVSAELERLQQLPSDQWNTITSFVGEEK